MKSQTQLAVKSIDIRQNTKSLHTILPIAILFAMLCVLVLLDAVLPLQYLRLYDVSLTHLGTWPLLPAQVLFPRFAVVEAPIDRHIPKALVLARSWKETALLFSVFLMVFLLYLLALHHLPRAITLRYILISTILLGIVCVLIPVVTSQDVFSYIAYARMAVIYHLNPLITFPIKIKKDLIFSRVYWTKQPSIYGPTWIGITCFLQWLWLAFGLTGILSMVLALRLFGLAMHLGATLLIWCISGQLQRDTGFISREKQVRAVLAFAWNPLLLFEACVNAHADVALLFVILLALWFLVRSTQTTRSTQATKGTGCMQVAALLAIATCLKLNAALLAFGLLLFLWTQPAKMRKVIAFTATYLAICILLYTPFWQGGAILRALQINPGASSNVNTMADFLGRLYDGLAAIFGQPIVSPLVESPADHLVHILSLSIFVFICGTLCWWIIHHPGYINNIPGLIRWLAGVWLLYCAIGSPWFWPWYMVTFFGLFALIEATEYRQAWNFTFLRLPLAIRLLTFSLLSVYCFYTPALAKQFVPGLPGFLWTYFRGLYIWMLPLLAICLRIYPRVVSLLRLSKLSEIRWLMLMFGRRIIYLWPDSPSQRRRSRQRVR